MQNDKQTLFKGVLFVILVICSIVYSVFSSHKSNYLKIFIVYYKQAPLIKTEIFTPIQAGRAIVGSPSRIGTLKKEEINWLNNNMIGDNTGENISNLNRYFAEITALYWIWKNTDSPLVGMFQYRRFLSLNDNAHYPYVEFPSMRFRHVGIKHLEKFSSTFLHDLKLEKKYILPWFTNHDILLAEPIKTNTYEQYKTEHIISDLNKALAILKQKYPEMYDFAIENLNSTEGFYPSNLFITRREILNNYATWLFNILLPLYEEIKNELPLRDTEQKLAFAYLSERLFTIYFRYQQKYHGLRIKEFPFTLASNFFEPPSGNPHIILKTLHWQDYFIAQPNNRICSFNNTYQNCGEYTFLPQAKLQIRWDNGETALFHHTTKNEFELEK